MPGQDTRMDRKEKISKILDRIHSRYRKVFEWLTCEDLGRDWEGVGNPYANKDSIVGSTGGIVDGPSKIVKNSQNLS